MSDLPLSKTSSEQLAVHPRTLQRRLAKEGVSCQRLIDRERRVQAAKNIADSRLQLSQVAILLGYTEQSTLNRSFRRWFGSTPRTIANTYNGRPPESEDDLRTS
ncbi:helix-turn-helix transcriptional regulator [Saccharopolyspora mangrovi]|uniref:helix-turn-helix transcriptional regulator n=1 Tax=Saccharopolyspora mangrovi TaxID=3082379 RepID=UPI00389A72A1